VAAPERLLEAAADHPLTLSEASDIVGVGGRKVARRVTDRLVSEGRMRRWRCVDGKAIEVGPHHVGRAFLSLPSWGAPDVEAWYRP
jgi:hypothetical protein